MGARQEATIETPATTSADRRPKSQAPAPGVGMREAAVAFITLLAAGVAAFASHIHHGGFYFDDWANGAGVLRPPGGPGVGNALTYFAKLTLYRPVLVLYVPLAYFVFGTHMSFHLAWAVLLAVTLAAALYGLLRTVGIPLVHSWALSALTIVYPWFDSTRFWMTASQASLSILFLFAGLWLAIFGLRSGSLRLHLSAALLYLLSILTYEVTLPVVALAGVLYLILGDWGRARTRWLIDIVVVVIGGLWVGLQTNHESRGVPADLHHLKEIVSAGGTMLGRSFIAVGEPRTALALAVLLGISVVGLGVYLRDRLHTTSKGRWGMRHWLTLVAVGMAAAALGWVMYIPANPYYTPTIYGVTNRVNALAGFGLVMAIYGALGVTGAIVGRFFRRPNLTASTVTVALGAIIAFTYVHVLERHSKIWNDAFHAEMAGIGEMRSQFHHLPHGTTIFASGYPANQTLGVPIFSSNWDVNGMVKLQYKDGTLSAFPVLTGLAVECRPTGVGLKGVGAPTVTASYGTAILLDVATGRHAMPGDRRDCEALAGEYVPGPMYLSFTY